MPQISSSGDNVYVVWIDRISPGNDDIFFAASTNNGQTFSTPINLSNTATNSGQPQISSSGDNNVYVVWGDVIASPNTEIFFRVSTNNGQTFSTPINLSNNAEASTSAQISSSGDNNVYVVWEDRDLSTSAGDIFFRVSTNNGQTFSTPPVNISNNAENSQRPQISISGDNHLNVVWDEFTLPFGFDIFFAVSTDNGQTFSTPPVNLSNNAGDSNFAQISTEGNNVYVVWEDRAPSSTQRDVFYITNNQDFGTFGNIINLSNNAGNSFRPQISSSTYPTIVDLPP